MHIGRSSTQELCLKVLEYLYVMLLQAKDTEWELVDQASTNGCYVNGAHHKAYSSAGRCHLSLGNVMPMGKDSIFVPEQIADTRLSEILLQSCHRGKGSMYCHTDTGACAEINDGNRAASGQRHTGKSSCNLYWDPPLPGLSSTAMGMFSFWLAAERKQDLLSVVPTLLMSLSMALGTILWPLLSKVMSEAAAQKRKKNDAMCTPAICWRSNSVFNRLCRRTAYLQHWYPPVSSSVDFLAQSRIVFAV